MWSRNCMRSKLSFERYFETPICIITLASASLYEPVSTRMLQSLLKSEMIEEIISIRSSKAWALEAGGTGGTPGSSRAQSKSCIEILGSALKADWRPSYLLKLKTSASPNNVCTLMAMACRNIPSSSSKSTFFNHLSSGFNENVKAAFAEHLIMPVRSKRLVRCC